MKRREQTIALVAALFQVRADAQYQEGEPSQSFESSIEDAEELVTLVASRAAKPFTREDLSVNVHQAVAEHVDTSGSDERLLDAIVAELNFHRGG